MTSPQDRQPTADKRALFVEHYVRERNATRAALAAGYSPRTAYSQGSRLLKDAEVRKAIDSRLGKLADRLALTTEKVAEHLAAIITADPNELIEYRRVCCRHCWGEGFGYQRTFAEMRAHRNQYEKQLAAWQDKHGQQAAFPEFDPEGGVGYNATHAPNPECPECFGEGTESAFPKDTRDLSPEALALYAGIKQTKDGLEVKMHSKERALELYGRHLGMFKDKLDVTGKVSLLDLLRMGGMDDQGGTPKPAGGDQ